MPLTEVTPAKNHWPEHLCDSTNCGYMGKKLFFSLNFLQFVESYIFFSLEFYTGYIKDYLNST